MQNSKELSRKSHKKYNLFHHLIFSTKYRRKIFTNTEVNLYLKMLLNYKFSGFKILVSETDKNHIKTISKIKEISNSSRKLKLI